jgi:hypothetical protein
MKIIDAFWDRKNTGLNTCEILFGERDIFQMYLDANVESKYDFSVVKIPVGNLRLVHQMEDNGYRYLENQMLISFEVDQLEEINQKWQRLLPGFTYNLLKELEGINSIIGEVNNKMFENDRFSLDPYWRTNVSSLRYTNWIRDMFEKKGTNFYLMKKNNEPVGFFTIKHISEHICNCPIAGIYSKFKSHGYFFALAWFWLEESKKLGYKKLLTSISTNNKAIHSFLSKVFFFRVNEILIVLRKRLNPE